MIGRIVYVTYLPFDERDLERFGVNSLRACQHRVEIWDISAIIVPRKNTPNGDVPFPNTYHDYRLCERRCRVLQEIAGLSGNDVVIPLVPVQLSSLFLYRAISRSPARYATLAVGNVVAAKADLEWGLALFVLKLGTLVRRVTPRRLIDRLMLRLPIRWLGIRDTDFCLLIGGTEAREHALLAGVTTQFIRCHSFDYDIFLMRRFAPPPIDVERYVVFIDEGVPYHREYELLGIPRPIEVDAYYSCLRRFIDDIERKYGWPVVIAESPRYRYSENCTHFGGRRIVRGDTCNLIRGAQFVITHASTAVSYAVMHDKPILFTSYDPDCRTVLGADILAMAGYFGLTPVPLTKPWRDSELVVKLPDESRYQAYFQRYIKEPGTTELSIWETFERAIDNPPMPADTVTQMDG